MIKKTMTAVAIAASAALLAISGAGPATAAGNLVENGHFDQTRFWTDDGKWYEGEKIGAWDVGAHSGENASGPTAIVWNPNMEGADESNAAPYPKRGWVRVMGSISQSIPTEVGKTYTLTYDSRATGSGINSGTGWNGGNTSYASVDGAIVDTFKAVVDPLYTSRSVSFTATSTSTLLEFGNAGGGAVGFDSIVVKPVPDNDSPIMVPAIAGGIGVAALAAGGFAFSRKNKRSSK